MKKREMMEWLSLAPADIPNWIAIGTLAGAWHAVSLNQMLGLIAGTVALATLSCYWGMPPRPEFSRVTNAARKLSYPLYAIVMAVLSVALVGYKAAPL